VVAAQQKPAADWPGADKFVAVQVLLDQNVVLVHQINENHASRTPQSLQRNVVLIRELNSNVQKIVGLYSELAVVLAGAPAADEAGGGTGGGGQDKPA
jgi:hypothetical protein